MPFLTGCIHLGYYSGSEFSGNGYAGSDRVRPYGSPQPVDIPPNSYNSNSFYGGNGVGIDGGGGGGGGIGGNGGPPGYDVSYDHGFDGNIWPDKMNVILFCFLNIVLLFCSAAFKCWQIKMIVLKLCVFVSALIEIAFVAVGWCCANRNRSCITRKSRFITIGNGYWKATPSTRYIATFIASIQIICT